MPIFFFRVKMNKANQFAEFWNKDKPNLAQLLKLENEDINKLPNALIQNIQNKILIQKLYKKIRTIEQLFFYPQTLTLENCESLQMIPGEHWTSKIYTLFYNAQIPQDYIYDIYENEDDLSPIPHTIYIQFVSFRAKMHAKNVLTHYFSMQPHNSIKIYN